MAKKTSKKNALAKTTVAKHVSVARAELRVSEYGNPIPTLLIDMPSETNHRRVSATVFGAASLVEMTTLSIAPEARWCVAAAPDRRCVEIELCAGDDAALAMDVLRGVAAAL